LRERREWLIHENAHEPLIDPVTFERAQRIAKERADQCYAAGFLTGKAKVSPYLLSGLMTCGVCGGSMHGRTTWKSKRRRDGSRVGTSYYVCGASITKGKAICQPIQFVQSAMDDFVMNRRREDRRLPGEEREGHPDAARGEGAQIRSPGPAT
jgi:hypothetical protein